MLRWLLELDKDAFLYLNGKHSPVLDHIMYWISQTITWIPFYVILLFIIIYRERPRRFIYTIIFLAIVVLLCDQISVLIKNLVERPRPSRDSGIENVHVVKNYIVLIKNSIQNMIGRFCSTYEPKLLKLTDYRGGKFGFVSSHAANVFGIAAFLVNWFKNNKWTFFLIVWATIVSYSRIYLGVHYPLDIICGALLGIIIGVHCYTYNVQIMVYFERKMQDRRYKKAAKRNNNNS